MLPDWVFDSADHAFMGEALIEADSAADRGEVPVGAVIARAGEIIARAGNQRQEKADPTGHAEIVALRAAGRALGDWRLEGCTMYVTLEPCPMCAAACRQARLELLVWGADDPRAGACGSVLDVVGDPRLGSPLAHRGGLAAERSRVMLQDFFAKQRLSS